jgi:hypothetical protein
MYLVCDDKRFLEALLKREYSKTFLKYFVKIKLLLELKDTHLDFFEFAFFEQRFSNSIQEHFLGYKNKSGYEEFFHLAMSRTNCYLEFIPADVKGPNYDYFLAKSFALEENIFKLNRVDEKLNNYFNFSLFSAME